jgi:hypothetical protein
LEQRFESAAGLEGRAHYSAVYSLPQQSPVLWINLNPGGTSEDHQILSDDQLAQGRHEFFEGNGKTSVATGSFLRKIFSGQGGRVRSIQGTNIVWPRSRQGSDLDISAHAKITAPFLHELISYVNPEVLIFGGVATYDEFIEAHAAQVLYADAPIMGNWGANEARIALRSEIEVPALGKFKAIAVSHPSRGVRAPALEMVQLAVKDIVLPPPIQMLA